MGLHKALQVFPAFCHISTLVQNKRRILKHLIVDFFHGNTQGTYSFHCHIPFFFVFVCPLSVKFRLAFRQVNLCRKPVRPVFDFTGPGTLFVKASCHAVHGFRFLQIACKYGYTVKRSTGGYHALGGPGTHGRLVAH